MSSFHKAIKTLEFDKITALLAECARTDGSKTLALRLTPVSDRYTVEKRLAQTGDAGDMITAKGYPPFSSITDITPSLERAGKGASMSPHELLETAKVLNTSRRLSDYFFGDRHGTEMYGSLSELFGRLSCDKSLENRITKAIISEEMIADEASPVLADIRRKIKNENNKIKDILQKYVSGAYGKFLQDNIVTQRGGRYVVPVKSEYKNEIKGLVHDTSASGATFFIEPLAVVDANNELRMLESKEQHEIERILSELSSECAAYADTIVCDYDNITEIAFIFAKGELSCRMNATCPMIADGRRIVLKNARHPLIDKKKVVPITVTLGGEYDTMVITGPNTGGKTVTLKTVGLLSLMAQAGLHIPCDEGSEICIFDSVLADIGDEQSIEQSLSTFSAHMVNIVDILNSVTPESIVLFDELGAGTDPTEGAALAMSIIEKVRSYGALCAATTHYSEIKAYALRTDGVINASCEFDVETLRPTYRLIIGTPGKSNAFAISKKLGISDDIIEASKQRISSEDRHFEQVIEQLERDREEMERQRDIAVKEHREFELYRESETKRLNEKIEKSEKELQKNREKAVQILESARITSDFVMGQLDEIKKKQQSKNFAETLDEGRRKIRASLRNAGDRVNPVEEQTDSEYVLPRELRKGDTVLIMNINQKGTLIDGPDKNGNVSVRTGLLNTRTKVNNLKLLEEAVQVTTSERKSVAASKYQQAVSKTFSPSLDLRGKNGDEAWMETDRYLDEAVLANVKNVTLIHGKGTGALREALKRHLKDDRRVKSYRAGIYGEGDSGVTVVEIR